MIRGAKTFSTALLIFLLLYSISCFASDIETDKEYTGALEEITGVEKFLGNTRLGGWLDVLYKDTNLAESRQFFDVHHVNIYVDNEMTDYWRAFVELEIEHAPELKGGSGSGEIKLERGYIQYTYNDYARGRVGKFFAPFGIWTAHHWVILMDTVTKPIHDDNQYVPNKPVGIEFFGSVFSSLGEKTHLNVNYAAYLTNGSESFGTNKPDDDNLGGGIDLNARLNDNYFLGISAYTQKNPDPRIGTPGRREDSFMLYGEVELPYNILLRSEYFFQKRSKGDPDIDVVYGKIKWSFTSGWYFNYRWNYGEDDKLGNGEKQTANTFTLSYWPIPAVRMRAEFNNRDFKDPGLEDFSEWIAWIGYIF